MAGEVNLERTPEEVAVSLWANYKGHTVVLAAANFSHENNIVV